MVPPLSCTEPLVPAVPPEVLPFPPRSDIVKVPIPNPVLTALKVTLAPLPPVPPEDAVLAPPLALIVPPSVPAAVSTIADALPPFVPEALLAAPLALSDKV